jgi:hypothetical protein
MDMVKHRQSVRTYNATMVPGESIERCLEAAIPEITVFLLILSLRLLY